MRTFLKLAMIACALFPGGLACAVEDAGRAKVGKLEVTVYFATNGDPAAAGDRAQEIPAEIRARLRSEEKLKFDHYRALGAETQPIFRSYENWAQPLKPSDEILVRFETISNKVQREEILNIHILKFFFSSEFQTTID